MARATFRTTSMKKASTITAATISTGQLTLRNEAEVSKSSSPPGIRRGPADAQDAVALDLHLGHVEDHRHHDQSDADEADGEHLECVEGQQQADDAGDAGYSQTGSGELQDDAQDPDGHEDVGDVGIDDGVQEALAPAHARPA